MSSERIATPQDATIRPNIGVVYNVSGINQPGHDARERQYAKVFADPILKKKYEELFRCTFGTLDYHARTLRQLPSEGPEKMAGLEKFLEEEFTKKQYGGYIAPGNDFNAISPGHNSNFARSQMEEAALKVTKKLGIPFLGICGGMQKAVFLKIKQSIKEEIFGLTKGSDNSEEMSRAFKDVFREAFHERAESLKALVVSEFEKERANNKGLIFGRKYVEDCLERLNSDENKKYINNYFSKFFANYLDFLDKVPTSLPTNEQTKDNYLNNFKMENSGQFLKYFTETTPDGCGREISDCKGFDEVFDELFYRYGEVNGIIVINNSKLLTGHNHCPEDGCNHLDLKSPMLVIANKNSPFYRSLPKRLQTGGDAEIASASEHNQAIVNSRLVKKHLIHSKLELGATDITGRIIKAVYGTDGQAMILIQNHPENFSKYAADLEKCTSDVERQRIADGTEFARNLMDPTFLSACREYASKTYGADKKVEAANTAPNKVQEIIASNPADKPWAVKAVTSAQVLSVA